MELKTDDFLPGENVQGNNPFTYGNPIRDPSRFFGRVREAEHIFSRLRNPEFESSSVVGDRRIGKTSLLNYITADETRRAYGLDDDSCIFVYADLQMVGAEMESSHLWRQLLASLFERCRDRDDAIASDLKALLRRDQLKIYDLDAFFRKADARGIRVVFVLDEFERITGNPNFSPEFYFEFRSLAIHRKVALVTSSRLELVELCHSDDIKSSPFFNIFANVNLKMFSEFEFEALVVKSLADTETRFTAAEIEHVKALAGCHPYFAQVACFLLYEAYHQDLDASARYDMVEAGFRAEAAPHFSDLWEKSGDSHKIVLTAAALLERRHGQVSGIVLADLKRVYSRAEASLAGLERRGLVMETGSGFRLFSSALGPWLIEQIVAESSDRRTFREWLDQNQDARSRVRGWRNRSLRRILPKVGAGYRQMILAWASDPKSVVAMLDLLKSALGHLG